MREWHRCEQWYRRGLPCPYGGAPVQSEGQEQEPQEQEEEAIRQSKLQRPGALRSQVRTPALAQITALVGATVGFGRGLQVAQAIPVPAELQQVARFTDAKELTTATGFQEDVRSRQIPRVAQAVVGAESGPRGLELLAGLPGADPAISPPTPTTVPFTIRDAVAAEGIVAHFFQAVQVQSEETGVARGATARAASVAKPATQVQSEEVTSARAIGTASEFGEFAQQAATLQILATLGVGMSGLERANLLGTQAQVGGSQPVRKITAEVSRTDSGLSKPPAQRVGPNVVKPALLSGSGDFKSFGSQFRSIGPIDRRFDVGVH